MRSRRFKSCALARPSHLFSSGFPFTIATCLIGRAQNSGEFTLSTTTGYLLYLTRQEHLQQMWSGVLFVVLFAFFAVIDRFLDPFGQRSCKDLPRRRPPWNHRWGP